MVHDQALPGQQDVQAAVAKPAALRGELPEPDPDRLIAGALKPLFSKKKRCALCHGKLGLGVRYVICGTAAGGFTPDFLPLIAWSNTTPRLNLTGSPFSIAAVRRLEEAMSSNSKRPESPPLLLGPFCGVLRESGY